MSKEILEFSIQVDEKFDLNFSLLGGFVAFVVKFFEK
ncbi:phenylalanyl-tRNA synthetase subunit alpha [Pedobacter sp. MW01-1-1]